MNLNALGNLLYKRKNVLAHPLNLMDNTLQKWEKIIGEPKQERGLCWKFGGKLAKACSFFRIGKMIWLNL